MQSNYECYAKYSGVSVWVITSIRERKRIQIAS